MKIKTNKNTIRKKKTPNKTKSCTERQTHKNGVHCVLTYSWAWGLPWYIVDIPRNIPLSTLPIFEVFLQRKNAEVDIAGSMMNLGLGQNSRVRPNT